jgi:beta-lactamase superfamily II metal-dependent hydrolase
MTPENHDEIRVRMYRVGFGDCFLVSFPRAGGREHVLIDCGVHARGNIGTLQAVVENLFKETSGKLALIIATHAHQDHISGFAAYEDVFKRFQVREVWLPWTEDPADGVATRLKQHHVALAESLTQSFTAAPPERASTAAAIQAALENATGNERALALLKSGVNGGKVQYLSAGTLVKPVAGIGELSARILGPPRDEKHLARMDPPVDQRFIRAAPGGALPTNAIEPFQRRWRVEAASNRYYAAITERDKNLLAVAATNAEAMAFALDEAVNNTSVVALFAFRGKQLLFAGDAQYGNWQNWLERPDAKALLRDVNFYKVSHHGSVNATPRDAVEGMSEQQFAAMVSTQTQPWASIPRPKLLQALTARAAAVVRSDSIRVEGAPLGPAAEPLPQGVSRGDLWFDYSMQC